MSAMASSKACLASWQALLGSFLTSQWKTEQLRARPSLMGWVVLREASAFSVAALQASWALSPALLCSAPEVYSEMYLQQSPFILQQKTWASALTDLTRSWLSMRLRISLQYLLSSPSTLDLQLLRRPMFLDPFCSSFFSMEESALQAVLLEPMVFLQATESRFLSSTVRSALAATTLFMASSMSSNLSVCSVILAMQRCSSRVVAVIFVDIQIKQKPQQVSAIQKSFQISHHTSLTLIIYDGLFSIHVQFNLCQGEGIYSRTTVFAACLRRTLSIGHDNIAVVIKLYSSMFRNHTEDVQMSNQSQNNREQQIKQNTICVGDESQKSIIQIGEQFFMIGLPIQGQSVIQHLN